MNRRDLLKLVPAAAGGWLSHAAVARAQAGRFPPALGVQLYTVRDELGPKREATLKAIADIGYREIESLGSEVAHLPALLPRYGLTAPSGHFDSTLVTGRRVASTESPKPAPTIEQAIEDAKRCGMRYFVLAYLPAEDRRSLDDYKLHADNMNRAAEKCRKAGLEFCYHNHSFEFAKMGAERPWDVLVSRCDRDLVAFEIDVFWVATAGLDPVETIKALGPRVKLLHLKDRAMGAPITFDEGAVPPTALTEVGSGSVNFPAVLRAAREVGVRHFFVEQDHTPGPPVESLRKSYVYLRKLEI